MNTFWPIQKYGDKFHWTNLESQSKTLHNSKLSGKLFLQSDDKRSNGVKCRLCVCSCDVGLQANPALSWDSAAPCWRGGDWSRSHVLSTGKDILKTHTFKSLNHKNNGSVPKLPSCPLPTRAAALLDKERHERLIWNALHHSLQSIMGVPSPQKIHDVLPWNLAKRKVS